MLIWQYPCMDPATTKAQLYNMALKLRDQATSMLTLELQRRRMAEQCAHFLEQHLCRCHEDLKRANLKLDCLKGVQLLLLEGGNILVFGVVNV